MSQDLSSGSNSIKRIRLKDMEEIHIERRLTTSSGNLVICPDLFGVRHLGTADNLRGKIVRAFAVILDYIWPADKPS